MGLRKRREDRQEDRDQRQEDRQDNRQDRQETREERRARIRQRIEESRIANSRFIEKAQDIYHSPAMKIILPIVAIVGAVAAPFALAGIVSAASAAVAAETATVGSLTVAALMASYQAYNVAKGVNGVKTLVELNEEDQVRAGLEQIFDVFRRRDLETGLIGAGLATGVLDPNIGLTENISTNIANGLGIQINSNTENLVGGLVENALSGGAQKPSGPATGTYSTESMSPDEIVKFLDEIRLKGAIENQRPAKKPRYCIK